MNPKSPEAFDEKPFVGMNIDDTSILDSLQGRSPCKKCHKSRKFFCYTCCIPVEELVGKIPQVELPVKIDIIKHKNEIDGKSTAIHAAVLAPRDVKIYNYPDIPDYRYEDGLVLIFPSVNAVPIIDFFSVSSEPRTSYIKSLLDKLPPGYNLGTLMKTKISPQDIIPERAFHFEKFPIKKAILIDSTWNQSKGIYKDERLKRIKAVVLQSRVSQFWRCQKYSPRWYLSTIEAIHQFLLEIHLNAWGLDASYRGPYCDFLRRVVLEENPDMVPYNGQYDNLLFFFKHMYERIHQLYNHEDLLAYKRPM